jgi:hypothetical protein
MVHADNKPLAAQIRHKPRKRQVNGFTFRIHLHRLALIPQFSADLFFEDCKVFP